jgi:hypothetical protein
MGHSSTHARQVVHDQMVSASIKPGTIGNVGAPECVPAAIPG